MDRLGRRKNVDLRANVVTEAAIKKATYELSSTLPWWLEKNNPIPLTTALGDNTLTLDAGFIRESEGAAVRFLDPDGVTEIFPRKKSHEVVQRQSKTGVSGVPEIYSIWGNNLHMSPFPDKVYSVVIPGYYKGVDLIDNASEVLNWYLNAPELMLCGIVAVVAESPLRDTALASRYKGLEAEQRVLLWKAIEARINANYDVVMGEDEEIPHVP